mgnify:CR=1 FL=1
MNKQTLELLRFPIGKFDWEAERNPEVLNEAIIKIQNLPLQLIETAASLPTSILLHRYRPEGWTIADSSLANTCVFIYQTGTSQEVDYSYTYSGTGNFTLKAE